MIASSRTSELLENKRSRKHASRFGKTSNWLLRASSVIIGERAGTPHMLANRIGGRSSSYASLLEASGWRFVACHYPLHASMGVVEVWPARNLPKKALCEGG